MPFHKRIYQHGNLIIQFKIKFPTHLDQKSLAMLTDALGTKNGGAGQKKSSEEFKDVKDVAETCALKQFEEHHRNTHHQGGTEGNGESDEDEDDGHPHGQRVGCQAQ